MRRRRGRGKERVSGRRGVHTRQEDGHHQTPQNSRGEGQIIELKLNRVENREI